VAEHKSCEHLLIEFQMENRVLLGARCFLPATNRSNTSFKCVGKLPAAKKSDQQAELQKKNV